MSDLERFARKLERHASDLEDEWRDDWSPRLADELARRSPVDSGRLAASWVVTEDGVESTTSYGVYVARGTSRMAPNPFDLRAVDSVIGDAADGAGDLVIRELTR